jgi:hypothetical protein
MRRHKCNDRSKKLDKLEVKRLSTCKVAVKYLKAKNADIETANIETANIETANIETANIETANIETANIECAKIQCADVNTIDVKRIYINGSDVTCSLVAPPAITLSNQIIDIGKTVPIGATGPATVDPVVFEALVANAFENRRALQCRIYDGRCAIYQYLNANGCPESCPAPALGPAGGSPDCRTYFIGRIDNNLLTVTDPAKFDGLEEGQVVRGESVLPDTFIKGPTGPTGTYLLNNSQTVSEEEMYAVSQITDVCILEPVELEVFGAMTLPIYQSVDCGPTGSTGPDCSCIGLTGAIGSNFTTFNTSVTFNLQCTYLLEVAKSIDARVVSVLVQVGSYDSVTDSVVIDVVFIANRQLYPTLDITYGENFANTISIPTDIISSASVRITDSNKQGAIQLVIYKEKGICIWNPVGDGFECRAKNSGIINNNTTQTTSTPGTKCQYIGTLPTPPGCVG